MIGLSRQDEKHLCFHLQTKIGDISHLHLQFSSSLVSDFLVSDVCNMCNGRRETGAFFTKTVEPFNKYHISINTKQRNASQVLNASKDSKGICAILRKL